MHRRNQQWCVYLIHLLSPLGGDHHKARYYLGSTNDLPFRLHQHRSSQGARMLAAANERGIDYYVIKSVTVSDLYTARKLERRLKARKNHALVLNINWEDLLDPMPLRKSALIESFNQYGIKHTLDRIVEALRESNQSNASAIAEDIEEIGLYLEKPETITDNAFRPIPRGQKNGTIQEPPY